MTLLFAYLLLRQRVCYSEAMKIRTLPSIIGLILIVLGTQALAQPSIAPIPALPPINSPATETHLPGKFIWFDLAAPDLNRLKSFYQHVFGWQFETPFPSDDNYTLILNGGKPIAGMFAFTAPEGEQDGATWIALMSVSSPAQATAIAREKGGHIELQPTTLAGRGEFALLKDPAGALFGVIHSSSGDPIDTDVPMGSFFWLDLFTRNPDTMADFYSALAPYEREQHPVTDTISRTLLSANGMVRAGLVPVDEEANRSAWVPYVRVNNVKDTLQKAIDKGAFAIVLPSPEILDGNLAVFVDPNGATMGIVKWEGE